MMNKGLEVIEACFLFDARPAQIEVVIHPQSVIHSMVEYVDGSVLAQLGNPDMRTPIAHALGFPRAHRIGRTAVELFAGRRAQLRGAGPGALPVLATGLRRRLRRAERGPVTLNAANEVAVERFLRRSWRSIASRP